MGKAETRLTNKMRKQAAELYGRRLVLIKQHGSEFARAGVSDLVGCLDGAFFACEVKAPETYGGSVDRALEKGPTLKQRIFVDKVNKAGGVAWFAADLQGFMDGLEYIAWMNCADCADAQDDYADPCRECDFHAAMDYYPVNPRPVLTLIVNGGEEDGEGGDD